MTYSISLHCIMIASIVPHNYLPLGIEEDLITGSCLELNGTDEDSEAEGRRSGVTALLEVSLAIGEEIDVTVFTGCNSTPVPVTRSLKESSII